MQNTMSIIYWCRATGGAWGLNKVNCMGALRSLRLLRSAKAKAFKKTNVKKSLYRQVLLFYD